MPLFDSGRFCRHLESAYETMWQRWRGGDFPQPLSVKPVTGTTPPALNQQFTMALQLHQQGKLEDAGRLYTVILQSNPRHFDALHMLGTLHFQQGAYAEADKLLSEALRIKEHPFAFSNYGSVQAKLKRFEEALTSYDRALALKPDYADALNNRGNVLKELKRFNEALASYDRALDLKPDYAEAHFNAGLLHLLLGDFKRGWEKYEWRWEMDNAKSLKRELPQPRWTGTEELTGKTILLHAEQGLGDTLQFCRYVPCVKARDARVLLEVPPPLKSLLSGMAGIDGILAHGAVLPDFDFHCPLLSLPLVFNTELETIPVRHSYINAPPDKVAYWKPRIEKFTPPRIGLVWSGNPNHKDDHNRSLPLQLINDALGDRYSFIALQTEVRPDDKKVLDDVGHIQFYVEELKDFAETAAIVENLDLVISVDTSVAHLAGALGKPVWILLPFVPDWRWLLDRADSPWYPSARLFRQPEIGDWESVLVQVSLELGKLCTIS
jgi:Tfp pilus assembly protein PilF